jgi:hypothetical protein
VTTHFAITIAQPPGDGWVRLPTAKPERASLLSALRGRDKALPGWAASASRELLGPDADGERARDYAAGIAGLAAAARERGAYLAYVQMSDSAEVPALSVEVSVFRTSRAYPELTLDKLEKLFEKRDPETVSLQVSRTELAAGPAVRLRRHWRGGDDQADTVVSVTYLCRPPEIQNAVVYTMYWFITNDYPVITEYADALAATLQITVDQ